MGGFFLKKLFTLKHTETCFLITSAHYIYKLFPLCFLQQYCWATVFLLKKKVKCDFVSLFLFFFTLFLNCQQMWYMDMWSFILSVEVSVCLHSPSRDQWEFTACHSKEIASKGQENHLIPPSHKHMRTHISPLPLRRSTWLHCSK